MYKQILPTISYYVHFINMELTHEITASRKSHDLASAIWRPRKATGLVLG